MEIKLEESADKRTASVTKFIVPIDCPECEKGLIIYCNELPKNDNDIINYRCPLCDN